MKKIWNAITAFYWHVIATDEAFYRHMQKTSPKTPAQGTLLLSAPVPEVNNAIQINPLKNGKTSLVDATGKTIGVYTRRADAMRAAKRRGLEVA